MFGEKASERGPMKEESFFAILSLKPDTTSLVTSLCKPLNCDVIVHLTKSVIVIVYIICMFEDVQIDLSPIFQGRTRADVHS